MAKLIDKDALVAEIERQQRKLCVLSQSNEVELRKNAAIQNGVYCSILSLLDTIEVKEVDLEKECSQYFKDWTVQDDLGLTKPDGWSCIVKDLYDIAKHFFELGLKAKQG